jgi:hypothetical protein
MFDGPTDVKMDLAAMNIAEAGRKGRAVISAECYGFGETM